MSVSKRGHGGTHLYSKHWEAEAGGSLEIQDSLVYIASFRRAKAKWGDRVSKDKQKPPKDDCLITELE